MKYVKYLLAGLLVFCMSGFLSVMKAEARDVVFCFAWNPYGKHVGFYVGREKGFYKAEGLDVKFVKGVSGLDNAKRTSTGTCTVASGGVDTLVIARAQGVKVRAIGVWHTKSMHVIYARTDRGIKGVKDLEGKSIATVAEEDGSVLFPPLAKAVGLDAGKVKFVPMAWSSKIPSMVSGSVDGLVTYTTVGPNVMKVAKNSNVDVTTIRYADHGLDLYSNGFLATEKMIGSDQDFLRKFMRASLKSLAYGVEHPDEGTKVFLKNHGEINAELARAHWDIAVDHLITPDTQLNGLGHIAYGKMKFTRDVIAEARKIKNVEPVMNYYTNEFQPKPPIIPKRPAMN